MRAHFIEARGITPPSTGRIYESNPVPVTRIRKSCKLGGDHIRRAAGALMAVEDRVRFGDLDVPKRITRSKTRLIFEINREIEPTSEGVCVEIFNYEIVLDHVGEIRFSSTGFNMYLRNFFPEVDAMALSREERGGISFERVTYNT